MSLRSSVRPTLAKARRFARRRFVDARRWIEHTRNFIHVSLLLLLPMVIGVVTFISNRLDVLPFLMFPPLASGAYTLFANPESEYATPRRFVAGMTAGAFCGWVALEISTRYWYTTGSGLFHVDPFAAALGVFLTGVVTWGFNFEEPQAFSTALLVLVVGVSQPIYVVSVFLSASLVAGVFHAWRDRIYEQRADYLYQTTHGDDAVLVPIRGAGAEPVLSFGARIAAAHEAGKVVLLEVVDASAGDGNSDTETPNEAETDDETVGSPRSVRRAAERLESHADSVTERHDVPCEVVVMDGDPDDGTLVTRAAAENSCDLIVTPYETADGKLSRFARQLFASDFDVIVFRATGGRETWHRILVPVKYAGGIAHAMLDFADRLAGERGRTTICHSIDVESKRREAERMLADLAETFDRAFETRVVNAPIQDVIAENTAYHDLTIIGSSSERTFVSQAIDPPTFKQLDDCDCDIAIVNHV
jgi:nucleotide-binding universal stress UspA family protein